MFTSALQDVNPECFAVAPDVVSGAVSQLPLPQRICCRCSCCYAVLQIAGPVMRGIRGMSSLLLESGDAGFLMQVSGYPSTHTRTHVSPLDTWKRAEEHAVRTDRGLKPQWKNPRPQSNIE